jgi:hypothetical protein
MCWNQPPFFCHYATSFPLREGKKKACAGGNAALLVARIAENAHGIEG